ncbi:MAG: bifunctional hydroxymethylpyrimidine kinase/phosphomethylpyrimidine kinase [Chloroflexi bacterium]|nr:bifunctional hydroxymethylpyrimidine kinase/phosphomethylpyrimidine kinase [Chloroflexota bacterium]
MEMNSATPPRALTIAGSDSGGGAGIQADLKTFAALGVFGTSAITAITAQNTLGVTTVAEVPVEVISDQIDAVVSDIGIDVVKTGMLSSTQIVECVVEAVERLELAPLVVDPVMIAATGAQLLQDDAVESVRNQLVPQASVVTPNVPEAETLTGVEIESVEDMELAGGELVMMGANAAVVKGGHFDDGTGRVNDVLVTKEGAHTFTTLRIDTTSNHGTGCTFASAVAAHLAHGLELEPAVEMSQRYVWNAMANAESIGGGQGPLNHMWAHSYAPNEQD